MMALTDKEERRLNLLLIQLRTLLTSEQLEQDGAARTEVEDILSEIDRLKAKKKSSHVDC